MHLKPIAKPVRIRIMSGGEEHSSLESLKHNFSLVDIKPLLDNRLIRWLERQGKEASLIAEELKSFDTESLEQENGQFAFIQLFFSDEVREHSLHSLPEIARYWIENQQYERNGSHLLKIIFKPDCDWVDLPLAKKLYYLQIIPAKELVTTFARFLNQEDSELYFLYGKLVYEGTGCKKDEDLGRKYLDKASALGSEDAKEFIIRLTQKKSSRLLKFEEELKDWRRKCCYAPFVSNADYDRMQTILNKYNLDILLCDLRTKGESNTEKLQSYVLSKFPN